MLILKFEPMRLKERIKQGALILRELQKTDIFLEVTGKNSLRITGKATREQLETCRQWKAQLIESLSPKCSNCGLPLELIEDGKLWFCPLGCESRS